VIKKLPNDSVSIENAIMLQRSNRWPLMIDPQGQANRWVKNMEKSDVLPLKVVKQTMPNFVRTIEGALQYGNPVLMENVMESLDPVLEPVLLKQFVYVGGSATIKLGDATVDYDPNFKMYLTTKLRNPHYPPELCVKVNLLNFMATAEGLEDQMQGIVVAKEEAELEALRERLVLEDASNKSALKDIEDKILHLLRHAKGNILDDEVLINTLAESKVKSNVIEVKVKEAAKTQKVIAKTRQGYKPVAFHASILFFAIADLMAIDPMYQYSLDWFITLFKQAIDVSEKADVLINNKEEKLQDRMTKINSCFDYLLYVNVCRSLFESHKLLFSFLLTTKLLLGSKQLNMFHLRYFLQGNTSVDLPRPNPFPDWLSEKSWGDLLLLDTVEGFKGLLEDIFLPNQLKWKPVLDAINPAELIATLAKPLTTDVFMLLCILRALRPDYVVPEVTSYLYNLSFSLHVFD
jgi:dynein heavy chain, axonemal